MLLDDVQQLSNKLGYPALELAQSLAWVRTAPLLTNEASRSIPCFPPLVLPDGDELQGGHSKALSLNEGGADLARFSWATRLAFAGLQVPHLISPPNSCPFAVRRASCFLLPLTQRT